MPIFPLSPDNLNSETLERAAQLIRAGELVAFPTETVYGLGANALDADAVQKIFVAKGRPNYNPLIAHVLDAEKARELVADWPHFAQLLSEKFWPGALTLVLPKREIVPDNVTAGLPSVAVRAPSHPIARALLQAAQRPIAAPSANRFTEVSPTTAAHVEAALGDRIAMILDGGACEVGIESTVLDLTQTPPVLLRPGSISRAQIEEIIGGIRLREEIEYSKSSDETLEENETPRLSPGLIARHYAPHARLVFFRDSVELAQLLTENHDQKCGVLLLRSSVRSQNETSRIVRQMPLDSDGYAREIYSVLHEMDALNCETIFVEEVPQDAIWAGVRDRLQRASKPAKTEI